MSGADIVPVSAVEWGPLNPARGDASPRAGTLWGDRTSAGESGFLVQFKEGFSSPPHIHNVTYRGVVIEGVIHNDDPGAADMWLPAGSFWTQPAGEAHVTLAGDAFNMAYVEIDDGPYLVKPTDESFDSGERPVNLDHTNLVWLDASDITWIDRDGGAKISFLWNSPENNGAQGALVKLPAGQAARLRSNQSDLRVVAISGAPEVHLKGKAESAPFAPGGYVGLEANTSDNLACGADADCLFYVRSEGEFEIVSAKS
ncbi:MAG TPA: hypothetical protein DEB52_03035 [Hyphomonas sp.]|nr:hypothetical protein [Hyphomonas sp.]